jgi:hypothetical protein
MAGAGCLLTARISREQKCSTELQKQTPDLSRYMHQKVFAWKSIMVCPINKIDTVWPYPALELYR